MSQAVVAQRERVTLKAIRKGGRGPDRLGLAGTEGIGKSTFAASAPSPIFIPAEDGMPPSLDHVPRFPKPVTLDDVYDIFQELRTQQHEHRTLVIDTLDALHGLVEAFVCARNNWPNIEAPGYGKGPIAAANEWRKILSELDEIRTAKGMEIILLSHVQIKTFTNPTGPDYMRYQLKVQERSAALVREWCDAFLFAIYEDFPQKDGQGKPNRKAVSDGARVVYTERRAAWDAKNRYGLPYQMALDYTEYVAARDKGAPADPAELLATVEELITRLAPTADAEKTLREYIEPRKGNAVELSKIVNKLRVRVAEKEGR